METKNNIDYPFDYQDLGSEDVEEFKTYFSPSFPKLIRLGSKGYFFFKGFDEIINDIYNLELRASDTFVVTFPRSGTTWTKELVWLLQNDCDFDTARSTPLMQRFPFIESGSFLKNKLEELTQNAGLAKFVAENMVVDPKSLSTLPSPRFLTSHLPLSLLPPALLDNVKVVYVARDPRDVAVSYFFHIKSTRIVPNDADFKPFWSFFMKNKFLWCPYFEHLKEAWSQRNHPNMTFIFYEELTKDLPAVARRLADFFGKEYSDEQFQALNEHLKFDNFKNNTSVNMKDWLKTPFLSGDFIRKGKAGAWHEHFDDEMTQQAESWINDNLRDTDLQFPVIE